MVGIYGWIFCPACTAIQKHLVSFSALYLYVRLLTVQITVNTLPVESNNLDVVRLLKEIASQENELP